MQVQVKLFSRFRRYLPQEAHGETVLELAEGAQISQLLAQLGIAEHVKLVTVNGVPRTDWAEALHEGDSIKIFPVVVGG
jgi:sulfur carrier protein ThiS